jgi:hypothetical protein
MRSLRSVALLLLVAGCDDSSKPPPPAGTAQPPASVELPAIDGGLAPSDPPPPAGDLKEELERFVNIDQCVSERAKIDPLLGDALRGIGYDTFVRDACRMLEAAKDRKRETCEKIDSSALRSRCQTWVAMIAQQPDQCPLVYEALPARGRQPSCIAIAGRDPRMCEGEPRSAPRSTCEAMATRDERKCDALLPNDKASCRREHARWKNLLSAPLEGLAKLPAVRAKMTIKGDGPTPDPAQTEVDLAPDFARGVVVVTLRERARVEIGSLGESEAVRFAPSPNKRPRAGLSVLLEPPALGSKEAPKPVLQKIEIEVPGEATLVYPGGAKCECKVTTARIDRTRGGDVAIVVDGVVSLGTKAYKVSIDLATFVRDVVIEQAGSKALPPLHPVIKP